MKKTFALVLVCLLVFSCTNALAAEISFWNGFTGSDGEILTEIVNRYNETNTRGDTIKMDIIPWANFHEKLPTAVATGTAPALVAFNNDMLTSYVSTGSLEPLDDFFQATGVDKANFNEKILDIFSLDGVQYQIPMQAYGFSLYWNKDLFKAAGLDPETPPKTWAELYEMAAKLTDTSKNVYGFGFPTDNPHVYANAVYGYGGAFVQDGKSVINSEINQKAFQEMQDASAKGIAAPSTTGPDLDNMLFAGQLALYTNGPWCINGCKTHNLNFGLTVLPAGDMNVPGRGFIAGTAFAIPKGTSQEQKDAAYAFMAYWNSDAICKEWSIRNGFPPYLKSLLSDPEIAGNPLLVETAKALDVGEANMKGVLQSSQIDLDVIRPMYERILGGANVKDELAAADSSINALLAG